MEFLKEKRKRCAQKDDIIAPHRKRYYDERNAILFSNDVLERSIENIIDNPEIQNSISKHIEELYFKARKLASRSRRNNLNRQKVDIVFSYNQSLFTLNLNINRVEDFNYFHTEYRKAIFLNTYDSAWKQFVTYVMGDLDANEINNLDNKYSLMKQSVNDKLINRLLNSIIPYNQSDKMDDIPKVVRNDSGSKITKNEISSDSPCPCGSGKKYCECHGSNIRNSKLRPRR